MRYISYIVNNYSSISELDSLQLDEFLLKLPIINENKDVKQLYLILEQALNNFDEIENLNLNNAHAALRDLGFIMSSIRRFGLQPIETHPKLEQVLNKIQKITNTIPRETSYHYGICNPEGKRQRVFTLHKDEIGLIEGVRIFAVGLERVLMSLKTVEKAIIKKEKLSVSFLTNLLEDFRKVLSDVGEAMRKINPKTFSYEIRPFFDPIIINGVSYVGPGGGQVPLLLIDNLLFAFDLPENHIYKVFSEEGIKFLTPELIKLYDTEKGHSTILSLCKNDTQEEIIDFLNDFLNELIRYRQVHYLVAKSALSKANRGNYETGSAGYRLEMVYQTLQATKEAKRKLNL